MILASATEGAVRRCSIKGCERKSHAKGYCGTCYVRIRRHADPEYKARLLATIERWKANHPGEEQSQKRTRGRAGGYRRLDLKSRYGITQNQYAELLSKQNGGCAICMSTSPGRRDVRHFSVDHDHKTGIVRGLLCSPCNMAIGLLKDDPKRANQAAAYLAASQ